MIGDLETIDLGHWAAWVMAALLAAPAVAADSSLAQQMLAAHNAVRAEVKTRPLVWSDKLAEAAQNWANRLIVERVLAHQKHSKYGENLFETNGSGTPPAEVVKRWASEAANYDYKTNRCNGACLHYTQIVWHDTRRVGCAVARGAGHEVWVCEYDPPGNYVGERPW
ncbi:MAG TPA: CAP domain-containing protein [Bryobacteraceae bacterium]|nr:CAP domain-containing protein [Bryobacteraceae bacterium]